MRVPSPCTASASACRNRSDAQIELLIRFMPTNSTAVRTVQTNSSVVFTTLELVWTVLTAVLFVGMNLMSSSIWASERFRQAEAEAVHGEGTRMHFAWDFRYPRP